MVIFFVVHDRIDTITINCNPNIQNLLPVNSIYYIVFGYSNNAHILIQQMRIELVRNNISFSNIDNNSRIILFTNTK